MIPPVELHRPTSVEEAVDLLAELGDDARVHAGGTELVLMLREGFLTAAHLVDIKQVAGLHDIRLDEPGGQLVLGATARHRDIAGNPLVRAHMPVLADVEGMLANPRVRNAGTIGGNLAFAEPHADPPALLVAAGAEIRLVRRGGVRQVQLDGWIRGPYDPDLAPAELLSEIRVPVPGPRTAYGYRRFRALERPSVSLAVRLDVDGDGRVEAVRLVAGCLGGGPQVIDGAGAPLLGMPVGELESRLAEVASAVTAGAEAVDDPHGPEDYKRHLAGVLATRAIRDGAAVLAGRR